MLLQLVLEPNVLQTLALRDLVDLAEAHPGNDRLEIRFGSDEQHPRVMRLTQSVDCWDPDLQRELERLLAG